LKKSNTGGTSRKILEKTNEEKATEHQVKSEKNVAIISPRRFKKEENTKPTAGQKGKSECLTGITGLIGGITAARSSPRNRKRKVQEVPDEKNLGGARAA